MVEIPNHEIFQAVDDGVQTPFTAIEGPDRTTSGRSADNQIYMVIQGPDGALWRAFKGYSSWDGDDGEWDNIEQVKMGRPLTYSYTVVKD